MRAHIQRLTTSSACLSQNSSSANDVTEENKLESSTVSTTTITGSEVVPVMSISTSFVDGDLPGTVIQLPDNGTTPLRTFAELYLELYEYFGDSLAARLPVLLIPGGSQCNLTSATRNSAPEPMVALSTGDESASKTGEQLLQQFLVPSSDERRMSVRKDEQPEDGRDADENRSDGNRSSRSSRSDENTSYAGDDADLTVKATVSDPSLGIKLTILKRPKLQQFPVLWSSLPPMASDLAGTAASIMLNEVEKLKDRKRVGVLVRPKCKMADAFECTVPLRNRDVIFVFKFQGRVQLCTFSERQKALILARDMAIQLAAVSRYRTLCARLQTCGKKIVAHGSSSGELKPVGSSDGTVKKRLFRGAFDVEAVL